MEQQGTIRWRVLIVARGAALRFRWPNRRRQQAAKEETRKGTGDFPSSRNRRKERYDVFQMLFSIGRTSPTQTMPRVPSKTLQNVISMENFEQNQ